MLTTLLAVLGTLAGAVIAGHYQQRSAGRAEQAVRAEQLRADRMETATALAVAISDHRAAMWRRGYSAVQRDPMARQQELREESHVTRSAVTRPLVALRILITDPAVRAAADHMVSQTYAMRDAVRGEHPDAAALTAARAAALTAHDEYVNAVASYLQTTH